MSLAASRSRACHVGSQNHAWVASIVFRGRKRIPSGVKRASTESPSSRCAAFRISVGMVICPLSRIVVRAFGSLVLSFMFSYFPIFYQGGLDVKPEARIVAIL